MSCYGRHSTNSPKNWVQDVSLKKLEVVTTIHGFIDSICCLMGSFPKLSSCNGWGGNSYQIAARLSGSCRQVLGRRRQCVDDRWTWTKPPGTTWRRFRRRLGWVLGQPPEPYARRHRLFSSCANLPSSIVIMQAQATRKQEHARISRILLRQACFWQESTWIICNARTLQTMLLCSFAYNEAAEMFELKHGGPRRFRRTWLWPTAKIIFRCCFFCFGLGCKVSSTWRASGDREVTKSTSSEWAARLRGF